MSFYSRPCRIPSSIVWEHKFKSMNGITDGMYFDDMYTAQAKMSITTLSLTKTTNLTNQDPGHLESGGAYYCRGSFHPLSSQPHSPRQPSTAATPKPLCESPLFVARVIQVIIVLIDTSLEPPHLHIHSKNGPSQSFS